MKRPWLAMIPLAIISGNLGNIYDVNDVDLLRSNVFRIINSSKIVESSGIGYRKEVFLISAHLELYKKIDAKLVDASSMQTKDISRSQNSLPLWQKVQAEMSYIDSLYRTFRQRLNETDEERSPFDDKHWMDFAKIVLKDPNNSIPSAMERINDAVQLSSILPYEVDSEI